MVVAFAEDLTEAPMHDILWTRKNGFATQLRFVATDSIAENVARVLQRAQAGGHGASERDIRDPRVEHQEPPEGAVFERVRVYDSTALWTKPRLVAIGRDGQLTRHGSSPAWL